MGIKLPKIDLDLGPVGKVLGIVPQLVAVVRSIDASVKAAKDDGSPGGRKVTVEEVAEIVSDHLGQVAQILTGLFVDQVS